MAINMQLNVHKHLIKSTLDLKKCISFSQG